MFKFQKPKQDDLTSFDLEDIDKICREIDAEEKRKSRKRNSSQLDQESSSKQSQASFGASVSLKSDVMIGRLLSELRMSDVLVSGGDDPEWLYKTVDILIDHLNKFGACVIDDFLGEDRGLDILDEVQHLQLAEMWQAGQHVSNGHMSEKYRNDQITWTDGVTPPSPSIKGLIR